MNEKYPNEVHLNGGMTRRKLLGGIATIGLMSWLTPLDVFAQSQSASATDIFVSVSKQLTERDDLHPIIAQRLYDALKAQSPQFDTALTQLANEMSGTDLYSLATQLTPAAKTTAKAVVSAWYTGIVGTGTEAQVITYRHALAFDAVDDVLQVRSYCPNKPGFWATKPIERKA